MVAHNPLHESGRAVLLHPALALGNNAKAVPGIRVTDANLRKPTGHMALHPSPRQVSSLTTPFEPRYRKYVALFCFTCRLLDSNISGCISPVAHSSGS